MPLTVGVGLFAQGGFGSVYKDLITPFGGRDELSALFGALKLTTGLGWQVTEQLSVGASVAGIYAKIDQRVFPDTSVLNPVAPRQSFFGFTLDDAHTVRPGFKLGAQYEINENATIGLAYTSTTKLPLSNGQYTADLSAAGLGKVTYGDSSLSGLALPREFGASLALNVTERALLAFEISWLNWDDALNATRLRASNPGNLSAPPVLENITRLDWDDQFVFALGIAFSPSERTTLLAGYNYGRNPIPTERTLPLLAPIAEHHLTAGASRMFGAAWKLHAGLEYVLPNEVTYDNPESAFGAGAQERGELLAAQLMLSRRW